MIIPANLNLKEGVSMKPSDLDISFVTLQRAYFLESLNLDPHLAFKKRVWSGTALHLLQLTYHIDPDMREAVDFYLQLSERVLGKGPSHARVPLDRTGTTCGKSSPRYSSRCHLRREEKMWRDLTHILIQNSIKNIVEDLGRHNRLELLRPLLKDESSLARLRNGLKEVLLYLKDT